MNYSAPKAREFCEAGAEGCPGVAIGGGYKGAVADRVCLCTIYDLRRTIWEASASAVPQKRRLLIRDLVKHAAEHRIEFPALGIAQVKIIHESFIADNTPAE